MKKLAFAVVGGVVALAGVALAVPHPARMPAIDYVDEPPLPERLARSWVPEPVELEEPVAPVAPMADKPDQRYATEYVPAPGYVNYYTLLRVRINRDY